ncbi:MAG: UDP-N-acetylmuramate dehydrogenase [Endomicrobium sp.]|jgi:UDP-N-acetylmuramate dehydrogenase|nr:UDP-N-acetylmuramate dehydrogenase [Endomicrobium sp.]
MFKKLSCLGCKILQNEPLSAHSSFKIGGAADFFIEISNENALMEFLKIASENGLKYFILGGGTNILFSDTGYRGAIIKLVGDFKKIKIKDEEIYCGSGALLTAVLKKAAENRLCGLQCAAGIPGTVGGAVFGNAGDKSGFIGAAVKSIEIIDFNGFEKKILKENNLPSFEYRKSGLENCIITKVNFLLKKEAGNGILKEILESVKKRAKNQPMAMPCAGCIFKNPAGFSAGRLIDEAGLKGTRTGGAEISEIHANFIVNFGGAKSKDVLELISLAEKAVKEKFNIDLELEIKIV